ncbi:MAG: hypothetical protein LBB88_03140, partial [Planctomycetaceae bacterium]|nr:hypothetical protein [Planctomycetaceae bacterium]
YNSQFHDYVIPAYKCRADYPARKMPTTNYFLVTGVGSAFDESGKFFMSKQTRDNKKVFLVESSKKVHWMCPVDVSFAEYNSENLASGTIRHRNVAYTDGSISMLKKEPFYYYWSKSDIFVYSVLLTLFVLIILQFFYLMLLYFFYFYKCSQLEKQK